MTIGCPAVQRFDLEWTPVPKGRPRAGRYGVGTVGTPARTAAAERELGWMLKAAGARLWPAGVPLRLEVVFQLRCPRNGTERPTGRPDLDNLLKTVLDAANGILWEDDAQVVAIRASKGYRDHAGLWLVVTVIED